MCLEQDMIVTKIQLVRVDGFRRRRGRRDARPQYNLVGTSKASAPQQIIKQRNQTDRRMHIDTFNMLLIDPALRL